MSISVLDYVWKFSKQKANDLLTLLAIADSCNENGDCFAGVERLASKVRVDPRSFQRITERLENSGELVVYANMGVRTKHGITNAYRIPMKGVNDKLPLSTPIGTMEKIKPEPRKRTPSKYRPFPKPIGVTPESPLGVTPESPHTPDGVTPESPLGVTLESPIPVCVSVSLEHPSEEPVAPSGATGNDQSALEEFIETLDMPEEEKQPEPPPAKQREPNPWYDAAFEVWGFTASRNTGMVNMLQGKAKAKQFKAYNIEPPLESPEKLLAWARWYKWVEQHGESLNMLEDQMKIQSSIGKWRTLGEPDPSAQVFQPTPLFESVRLKIFGTDDPNARGQQMENITSWLSGELDGGVGKLSASATPTQVGAFSGWYKSTYPNASLPRDLEKFANSWRVWAKGRKSEAPKQQQPIAKPQRQLSPAEFRALQEKLKAQEQPELESVS